MIYVSYACYISTIITFTNDSPQPLLMNWIIRRYPPRHWLSKTKERATTFRGKAFLDRDEKKSFFLREFETIFVHIMQRGLTSAPGK